MPGRHLRPSLRTYVVNLFSPVMITYRYIELMNETKRETYHQETILYSF